MASVSFNTRENESGFAWQWQNRCCGNIGLVSSVNQHLSSFKHTGQCVIPVATCSHSTHAGTDGGVSPSTLLKKWHLICSMTSFRLIYRSNVCSCIIVEYFWGFVKGRRLESRFWPKKSEIFALRQMWNNDLHCEIFAGGERGILNPALWLPPSATFSLVGLTNRHFVQDETGKIDWFLCIPAHTRKKNSTANAVLFFLAGAEGLEPSARGFGAAVGKRKITQTPPC